MPERSTITRLRPIALVAIAALSALLAMPAGADGRVADSTVAADVIGVVPLRSPGRGVPWRARVTVLLDDGTRVRLTYGRPHPRVGDRVQLLLSDGELKPFRPAR
jgi:hypothetical protein